MLKQGLPPEHTRQKKTMVYLGILIVIGLLIAFLLLKSEDFFTQIKKDIEEDYGLGVLNAIVIMFMVMPISIVQTFILKDRITASKIIKFILSAAIGGLVSGFIAGKVLNNFETLLDFKYGLLMGALIGTILGIISAIGQNAIMKNKDERKRWFYYSCLSNMAVWSIGFAISWIKPSIKMTALSVIFIMAISGIALSIFLPNTDIEF
ncbi:MAG: hypothetical protein PWP52_366 [Bacteroidales bacterium]|nr:hypothetical protein [Bacteroidales bacterium]